MKVFLFLLFLFIILQIITLSIPTSLIFRAIGPGSVLGNIIFQLIIWGHPKDYPKYIQRMLHSQLQVSRTNGLLLLYKYRYFIVLANTAKNPKTNGHVNI